LHWEDIIKRNRRKKRKREPYNPFTGEGHKGLNIEDRLKARQEKEKEREAKVAESFKKVPRARVSVKLGGGAKHSPESTKKRMAAAQKRMAAAQDKKEEESVNLNPISRCAKCGIQLSHSQQTKTKNNAANLNYCGACARGIEGKTVARYRTNAKGDLIPTDTAHKRPPIRRRKFK